MFIDYLKYFSSHLIILCVIRGIGCATCYYVPDGSCCLVLACCVQFYAAVCMLHCPCCLMLAHTLLNAGCTVCLLAYMLLNAGHTVCLLAVLYACWPICCLVLAVPCACWSMLLSAGLAMCCYVLVGQCCF